MALLQGLFNFVVVKCRVCGLEYSRNAALVERNAESICGRCAAKTDAVRKR